MPASRSTLTLADLDGVVDWANWGELHDVMFPQGTAGSLILQDLEQIFVDQDDEELLDLAFGGPSIAALFGGFPEAGPAMVAELDVVVGANGLDVPSPLVLLLLGLPFLARRRTPRLPPRAARTRA